jgi:hypothetical protein
MDKISGIIPSSSRVTNVDLKDAPPSRAALPGAERQIGAVARISEGSSGSPAWKTKEARQAALVNDVSNSFFMKNKPEPEAVPVSREQNDEGHSDGHLEGHLAQPQGLFPKGSFIDRNA